jgi:uncharacterized protein (DUF433 family)
MAPTKPIEPKLDRISADPAVCSGASCIRGMRIRVKDVLALLNAGATRQEILADYPYLEDEDITAALNEDKAGQHKPTPKR